MNWIILKNDFKRNKVINFILILFMVFSSCFAASAVIMGIQTVTSISKMYKTAQPPHFLQMHKGALDFKEINDFMSKDNKVVYHQVCRMIDVYGESISVVKKDSTRDFSDCQIDLSFVKQNESRDLLIDSSHKKVVLKDGEVGIPILLKEMYDIKIGDNLILECNGLKKQFVVKEFILDSMMNSTMCSSTRILLSDNDFDSIYGKVGEIEYLIESYFENSNYGSEFKTKYENAGMPTNGQAITYSMIFLLSSLTDLVSVLVILLVSILLIIISFICIRFTIMAALEGEVSEIGTMKAIGISYDDIMNLYMVKYKGLALIGVFLGYGLSLIFKNIFTRHLSNTFGKMGMSITCIGLSFASSIIIFLIFILYFKKVLKRIKNLTIVDALVNGNKLNEGRKRTRDGLYKSKKIPVDILMPLREIIFRFKDWIIMFSISLIVVFMILVPVSLIRTMDCEEFVTYMGCSVEDIMIEVKSGEKLEESYKSIKTLLADDKDIRKYDEYRSVCIQTYNSEDEVINLHVECGKSSGQGLKYLEGNAPDNKDQIALSILNADKCKKETGDKIKVLYNGKERELTVCGIYQDITSGGYTAKSIDEFKGISSEKYSFLVDMNDNKFVKNKADQWSKYLGGAVAVKPMKEFSNQTFGGVVTQVKSIIKVIILIGIFLECLIAVLFLRLRLAKDLSEIAILKSMGFSENDIKKQYAIKMGVTSLLGGLAGMILAGALGERIINIILSASGLGIKKLDLIYAPLIENVIVCLSIIAIITSVTLMVMRSISKYTIVSIINE